jgi:translation initiation factor eIF-2B subunit alpha/methylthioribose-1-phosphate isomerase
MLVDGKNIRSVWYDKGVKLIDQRKLPDTLEIFTAHSIQDVCFAIKDMVVRGAPAIGATAAYGMILAENPPLGVKKLKETRPTAHDLFYALDYMIQHITAGNDPVTVAETYVTDIINRCKKIGEIGNSLIKKNDKILTHCNAGALATVDYGTALAPIRMAKNKDVFIWVDETRPRLQGHLTSWELTHEGINHAVIVDNAAGYFMAQGEVDLVIVGADRIAQNGDVANKIGTFEKAVLAHEQDIPFYVAAPHSTIDPTTPMGQSIPIEERSREEITHARGKLLFDAPARNPAFDITPASYITGIITEKGIFSPDDIKNMAKIDE